MQNFLNKKTVAVARGLIGCLLCRKISKKIIKLPITEVEAYDGPLDKASHASRGKTRRNYHMYEQGGIWYVYLIYGNYWMLNLVTGPKNYPAAILIRSAGNIRGPGRLTKFLKIGKQFNGQPANKKIGLWIERPQTKSVQKFKRQKITRTARIGVSYAGLVWSKKSYRFVV